jgi:hypothetical protein
MKTVQIRGFLLLLTCLLFLSGCASTRVTASWSDEAYRSGRFSKPLVLAIAQKQIVRSKAEDGFVQELRAIGVDAVQSYKLFPGMDELRPDLIKAKLSGTDRDSILVTHLVDVKNETVYVQGRTDVYATGGGYGGPAHYNSFGSYYNQSYSVVSSPAYNYEYKVFVMETNLYDAATDKLAWTVMTETDEPESIDAAVREFVKIVMKDLRKSQVLHESGARIQ